MIITFEQGLALFGLACSGLGLFAWLVWWLSQQFNGIKSLIHVKHNKLDRRVTRLEWHSFGTANFVDDGDE